MQVQVLNLLADLKERLSLTYMLISHDLMLAHYVADRVLVMYLGKIFEIGPADSIYANAAHPYTKALLASRLSMNPAHRVSAAPLTGDPPIRSAHRPVAGSAPDAIWPKRSAPRVSPH